MNDPRPVLYVSLHCTNTDVFTGTIGLSAHISASGLLVH